MSETKINDGGTAFPDAGSHVNRQWAPAPGMTLRDYFAAKAMSAMANRVAADGWSRDWEDAGVGNCCEMAYHFADAMLKARAK